MSLFTATEHRFLRDSIADALLELDDNSDISQAVIDSLRECLTILGGHVEEPIDLDDDEQLWRARVQDYKEHE